MANYPSLLLRVANSALGWNHNRAAPESDTFAGLMLLKTDSHRQQHRLCSGAMVPSPARAIEDGDAIMRSLARVVAFVINTIDVRGATTIAERGLMKGQLVGVRSHRPFEEGLRIARMCWAELEAVKDQAQAKFNKAFGEGGSTAAEGGIIVDSESDEDGSDSDADPTTW